MLSCTKVFIIEIETLFERSISERNYLIFILSDKNRVYMYQVRKSVDLDIKHKTKNHQAVHIHLLKRVKRTRHGIEPSLTILTIKSYTAMVENKTIKYQ